MPRKLAEGFAVLRDGVLKLSPEHHRLAIFGDRVGAELDQEMFVANSTDEIVRVEIHIVGTRKKSEPSKIEGFDEFYSVFPRREDRGHAERAYEKALKSATSEILISAAKMFAQMRAAEDPKFTPLPATWLNGKRWLDVRGGGATFRPTGIDGWVVRLKIEAGLTSEAPKGTWYPEWGARRGEPNCMIPTQAIEIFERGAR